MNAGEGKGREKEAAIIEKWKIGMGDEGEMMEAYPPLAITDMADMGVRRRLEPRLAKLSINRVCGPC